MKGVFLLFVVCILLAIGAASVGVTWYIIKISEDLPSVVEMMAYKNSVGSIVYDRNNKVIARLFIENRTPLQLHQVSPWFIKAILAAEDSAFYQHRGIRISSIIRALWTDLVAGGKIQGASTITQQLARNLFLTHEKSITRKAKEIIISIRMEKLFSKDKILEMYLNTINFGRGAWGVETAARTYFGKPAADLDVAQASILAGLIANPGRYNPLSNLENAKVRQNYVLGRMEALGWISEAQRLQAYNEVLEFRNVPNRIEEFNRAPYFVSHILFNELLPKYGKDMVYSGGLKIRTTLDLELQLKAQEAIRSLKFPGALVCMASDTGEVLALVGGKDFKESKFNRATQAYRQPGSSFKPIVYAAALENDILPSDHFMDARITFARGGGGGRSWSPKNSSGKYAGEVTLQQALTHSYNTVAVRAAAYIGTESIVTTARNMGITSKHLPNDLSVALGAASVTPLEMTVAFNCFNNEGRLTSPLMIREVIAPTGEVLESNAPRSVEGIRPETAYTLRSMMMDVVRAGTGTRARLPETEVFGKTGSSNDFIDAWFIGGTPGLTTALYVGKDDHTPMGRGSAGGVLAAPAWKDFMTAAVEILKTPQKFAPPPDWVEVSPVTICRTTGYRAMGSCPKVPLYMPSERAPDALCPLHGGDYTAAYDDPRGPRLFLIEQDEYIAPTESVEVQPAPAPAQMAPEKIPQEPDPYRYDPSPADEVERRYQELLKEYGITD
ncbi:MAG: PBP1A family penicillin-binding protein [Fretibacterium sp.]|nr:PBP1A family penicillin-binding protein [Fretibacterium sp.]